MNSLLIEASAGSGKTFQLSNRFIALLALEQDPGDLIALTFTRKAAGEFARRILNRLAEGAENETQAAELAKEITPTLIGDPDSGQPGLVPREHLPALNLERFQELLSRVVHQLDKLQLSTLDSFFTRLVRCFGPELGLNSFDMLDEEAHRLEQEKALLSVLDSDSITAKQRQLFLKAFEFATYGKEEMKVADLVMEFIQDHHGRFLQASQPENWGDSETLFGDDARLENVKTEQLSALQQEIQEATATTDFGHKTLAKTVTKFSESITDYSPGNPLPKPFDSLFKWTKGCEQGDTIEFEYYKKPRNFGQPLSSLLLTLRDLVVSSEIAINLSRTQGIWAVISAFEARYDQQARRRGKLGFSDISFLLEQHTILAERSGFNPLAYRLDSEFRHWMLDEFQDTSRQQFDIVEPVLTEAVDDPDQQRSLFVVGDTKQAIYGWRSGEPRLMQEMRDRWDGLHDWSMSKSYRSSQSVLDFVNLICDPKGQAMQSLFPQRALDRWKFSQHRAAKNLTGCTTVYEIQKEAADDIEGKNSHLATLAILEDIEPIERGLSCAVLVGSNNQVAQIASFLRHNSPYPVETDASVPVSQDSPLGLALLDWFRFLVHPEDEFAANHVARSPLSKAIQHLGVSPREAWLPARIEISSYGVATHLNKLARTIESAVLLDDFQSIRLEQIINAANEFDLRGGKLEEWLKKLTSLTHKEASQTGSIQVMTVHKSKGLEFDIVILPELASGNFDDSSKLTILTQEDERHLPQHFLLRPRKDIVEANAVLNNQFEDWVIANSFERFCNLYVALTRAAHSVICLLPPRSKTDIDKDTNRMNPSGWIHQAVGDTTASETSIGKNHNISVTCLYQNGESNWFTKHSVSDQETSAEISPPHLSLPAPAPRQANRTASGSKDTTEFSKKSTRSKQAGLAFGNEVHNLFESITRWNGEHMGTSRAAKIVTECLQLREAKHWFSPPENVEILNEQSIEAIDTKGAWFSGVVDRILITRDQNGRATKIQILDYKTDNIETEQALVTRYQSQLQAYAHFLAQAENLPIKKIETHLLSTKLKTFIQIGKTS